MEEMKTKIYKVTTDPKILNVMTTKQLKTIQIEEKPDELKTLRAKLKEVKIGAQDTRKIEHINPFFTYFPKFYIREIRNAFILFISWTIIFVLSCGASATAIYFIVTSQNSSWLCLLLVPPFVITLTLFITYLTRFYNLRAEAKTINFKDEKFVSINIQKLYKRLKTGYININWMCLTSYILFSLFLLFEFVVAKILNPKVDFGNWDPTEWGGNHIYEILFLTGISALVLTLLLHVLLIIFNYLRSNRIENFYNFMIVEQQELNEIKKQKNKRDLIICLTSLCLIGILIYFIYKLIKRKRTVQVTV